ncbi:MAG: hypothetical protein DI570_16450 [Phenylobacterium zucineum]|nr:MAG: hypothetical protein DI570_16450 [Phenylobacterium zucineum]
MLSFVQEHFARARNDNVAIFSQPDPHEGRPLYRYFLGRTWDWALPRQYVVMVNPSSADADQDDPTIARLTGFAKRWGCGGLGVINLFALISPDPKALDGHADPRGQENHAYREHVFNQVEKSGRPLLVAWGNNGSRLTADRQFIQRAKVGRVPLICLGLTQHGHPKHPLARGEHRIPDDFDPIPFEPPWWGSVTIGAETVPLHPDGRPACGRCNGVGRLNSEAAACWRCGGSGEHPNPFGEQT